MTLNMFQLDHSLVDYKCQWFNGHGIGGSEIYVDVFAPEACVKDKGMCEK